MTRNKNTAKQSVPPLNPRFSAATADRHRLYQLSVQAADPTLDLLDSVWRARHAAPALKLREDFCGTAYLAAQWVRSDPRRTAVGLDTDRATLDWGARHNLPPLGAAADRVELMERDVREGTGGGFDIVVAFNFSYCVFHERRTLVEYMRAARRALAKGGCLVMDMHGGPDSQCMLEETTVHEGFEYVWEHESFDPITHRTVCRIHFRFPDGTELPRAFTYDWRHWSMPELRDALSDAGFRDIEAWWDDDDDVIRRKETAVNTESWVGYLVAWR